MAMSLVRLTLGPQGSPEAHTLDSLFVEVMTCWRDYLLRSDPQWILCAFYITFIIE